jgi:hypothetical protein
MRLPLGRRASREASRLSDVVAALLVLAGIGSALAPAPSYVRAAVAVLCIALAATASRVLGRRQGESGERRWLLVDDEGVHRLRVGPGSDEEKTTLALWSEPFGFTVVASSDRAAFLLALTSPRATRYLAARVMDAEDAAAAPNVLERATTASASDLRPEDDSALSAADAERLLVAIARRAPASLDRMYLSDAAGEPVVLDRAELRVGPRRIDLASPLEWHATLYQERGAHAASVCQATWIHQGEIEVVLVSPLPADGAWMGDAGVVARVAAGTQAVKRSVARDLRLIQAPAGDAPPRDLRHAIDRVFMLPLRRALDRAPRSTRSASPSRPMPEGRA